MPGTPLAIEIPTPTAHVPQWLIDVVSLAIGDLTDADVSDEDIAEFLAFVYPVGAFPVASSDSPVASL